MLSGRVERHGVGSGIARSVGGPPSSSSIFVTQTPRQQPARYQKNEDQDSRGDQYYGEGLGCDLLATGLLPDLLAVRPSVVGVAQRISEDAVASARDFQVAKVILAALLLQPKLS